jgi:transposase
VIENVLSRRTFPEQGFRSCMGILSLGKRYSNERLEAACERALFIKGVNYKGCRSSGTTRNCVISARYQTSGYLHVVKNMVLAYAPRKIAL